MQMLWLQEKTRGQVWRESTWEKRAEQGEEIGE